MSGKYIPLVCPPLSPGICNFFDHLCDEVNRLNSNFILELSSCRRDQRQLCAVAEKFCKDLQHCFEQAGYLPPNPSRTLLQICLIYNLLYASFLKARCTQQHQPDVLSSHALSVFMMLRRVGDEFGLVKLMEHCAQLDLIDPVQQVTAILPTLLQSLLDESSNNTNLGQLLQYVGMLVCMWSLLILLEKGASIPLPWLSFLSSYLPAEEKDIMEYGFLVRKSSSQVTSTGCVQSFANLLLAVSSFHRHKSKECEEQTTKVCYSQWKPLANILAAQAMLQGKHHLEAFRFLQNVWSDSRDSSNLSFEIQCEIYKLLASSSSALGWKHTPIELLRLCLQCQPESPTALCMVAQQFGILQKKDAEMDFLRKLVKAVEKAESRRKSNTLELPLLDDLLHELVVSDHMFTLPEAVYLLAQRAAQLERYEEASQAYKRLIELCGSRRSPSTEPNQSLVTPVPDLLTVCREAAQTLLNIPQHRQCLQLCDRVLSAVLSSDFSSRALSSQPGTRCHSSRDQTLPNQSLNISELDTSASENFPLDSLLSDARRRVCSEEDVFDHKEEKPQVEWRDIENQVLLMVCKAECLLADGDRTAAVDILTRASRQLAHCWAALPVVTPGTSWKAPAPGYVSSQTKNSASEQSASSEKADQTELRGCAYFELSHQVLVCLCDALCRCGQFHQAVPMACHALQLRPERMETQYFAYSTQTKLGKNMDSVREWLQLRGLPHNASSDQLLRVSQERQEMIRSLPEEGEDASERQRLGVVTERQKLHLDLACLKLLAESKAKT